MWWNQIVTIIGPIATALVFVLFSGGAITGLAYALFKFFGEQWLGNIFKQRLEAFKHDQQKEIEHLRFEISRLMDRTTKLHQYEFTMLPKAWALLSKSYHWTLSVTSSLQSYPDVNAMGPSQLEEFLAESSLLNWQREELRQAHDRNKYYQDAVFWHHLGKARSARRKFAIFVSRNGIFVRPEIMDKFNELDAIINSALVEHEINKETDSVPRLGDSKTKLKDTGEPLFKSLEEVVRLRLWN